MPSLLTKELQTRIPALGETEVESDPLVQARFFAHDGHWTWFVLEYDGDDTFFGYVKGDYPELGYFSLAELQRIRGPFGLPVELDRHFKPKRLSELR